MEREWTTQVPRVSGFYERRSAHDGRLVEVVEVICRDANDYALCTIPAMYRHPPCVVLYDSAEHEWRPVDRRSRWQLERPRRISSRVRRDIRHDLAWRGFSNASALCALRSPFMGQRDHAGAVHEFVVACVRVALEDAYQRGFDDAY